MLMKMHYKCTECYCISQVYIKLYLHYKLKVFILDPRASLSSKQILVLQQQVHLAPTDFD